MHRGWQERPHRLVVGERVHPTKRGARPWQLREETRLDDRALVDEEGAQDRVGASCEPPIARPRPHGRVEIESRGRHASRSTSRSPVWTGTPSSASRPAGGRTARGSPRLRRACSRRPTADPARGDTRADRPRARPARATSSRGSMSASTCRDRIDGERHGGVERHSTLEVPLVRRAKRSHHRSAPGRRRSAAGDPFESSHASSSAAIDASWRSPVAPRATSSANPSSRGPIPMPTGTTSMPSRGATIRHGSITTEPAGYAPVRRGELVVARRDDVHAGLDERAGALVDVRVVDARPRTRAPRAGSRAAWRGSRP